VNEIRLNKEFKDMLELKRFRDKVVNLLME